MGGATKALDRSDIGTEATGLRRTLALLLPVFLLAALMLMVSDRADASTASAGAAATASVSASSSAQINTPAIICPFLLSLQAAFGPFGGFLIPTLIRFGCITAPSG